MPKSQLQHERASWRQQVMSALQTRAVFVPYNGSKSFTASKIKMFEV